MGPVAGIGWVGGPLLRLMSTPKRRMASEISLLNRSQTIATTICQKKIAEHQQPQRAGLRFAAEIDSLTLPLCSAE